MPRLYVIGICCLSGLIYPAVVSAQTSAVSGVVLDGTGAAVPGATVLLINESTNAKRAARSDRAGFYAVPLVSPGTYRLSVESPGFQRFVRAGVIIEAAQQVRLDAELEPAGVEDEINVRATTPVINRRDGTIATVVDARLLQALPLQGRTLHGVLNLVPGSVTMPAGTVPGQFSFNGQRTTTNAFTIDGVSANVSAPPFGTGFGHDGAGTTPGFAATGSTANLVSLDAVREIAVQTSTYSAEYGRAPGGQINIVTKSGSNLFSGSTYVSGRHSALDATDWFVSRNGVEEPRLRIFDSGAQLGGPIRRDRAFFLATYEAQRLSLPRTRAMDTPSSTARAAATPLMAPFLRAFPEPSTETSGSPVGRVLAAYSDTAEVDAFSARGDMVLRNGTTSFVRLTYAPSRVSKRGGSSSSNALNMVQNDQVRTYGATVGVTHVMGRASTFDVRLNVTRNRVVSNYALDSFGNAGPLPMDVFVPEFARGLRTGVLVAAGTYDGAFLRAGALGGSTQHQIQATGSFVSVWRAHQVKLGADYRSLAPHNEPTEGTLTYNFTTPLTAGSGMASRARYAAITPGQPEILNTSLFAQDTWQVSRRLALDLGVRWDINPAPRSRDGVEPVLARVDATGATLLPRGSRFWDTSFGAIAPRVSAAFVLRDAPRATVLRGGWGTFYDPSQGWAIAAYAGFPFTQTVTIRNVVLPLEPDALRPMPLDLSAPGPSQVYAFSEDLRAPRTYHWNITVDQEVPGDGGVSVSYVGAAGRNLGHVQSHDLTRLSPNIPQVFEFATNAWSDYDALQIQYRRVGAPVGGLVAYTFAKSVDTVSDDFLGRPPESAVSSASEKGDSDFDVRHNLKVAVMIDSGNGIGGRMLRALTRRSSITLTGAVRSALPITPFIVRDAGFGFFQSRPDLVTDTNVYIEDPNAPGGWRVNKEAFVVPTEARQGNLPRNSLRGFPLRQIDLAVRRTINVASSATIELSIEVFNLTNTPNFGAPDMNLASSQFGEATSLLATSLGNGTASGGLNPLYQIGGPRSIQGGLRLRFGR